MSHLAVASTYASSPSLFAFPLACLVVLHVLQASSQRALCSRAPGMHETNMNILFTRERRSKRLAK